MISFKIRYDEHTMLWQYQPEGKDRWSEPMRYGKVTAAIGREIQRLSVEEAERDFNDLDKRWSMPLPHNAKGKRSEGEKHRDLMDRYEIRGGKVVKLGYTHKDRVNDQADELLKALEGVGIDEVLG